MAELKARPHGGTVFAGFDTNQGFTVTNNTSQNVYLQTEATTFETILPQQTSTAQTGERAYPVRNNNTTNAPVYLTVSVSPADASVNIISGTQRGSLSVNANFV